MNDLGHVTCLEHGTDHGAYAPGHCADCKVCQHELATFMLRSDEELSGGEPVLALEPLKYPPAWEAAAEAVQP